ncbi:DUF4870 domain-containing protein [Flavobacterium muglaense]|uniref:DUF4870 domain-containing protein n=1 Tax=Flavobacterium muglaense TaxID=2764716 RepID=A0A923MYE9_9FLAO|nr:DUF4870 domain-containing protein [Flavobacterium muglaense]MBC5837259.1 DUF4870 domain-containing protein [Flavobacterium muglaense]MBC5843817.1 DUF4870 domain-containing protein [Flavobacterium muglaense]
MDTITHKNAATFIHLSTLSQYFIPFGNYIFPILVWSTKKDESDFVDYNGKQVLNFQLSLLLYSLVLIAIAVPVFIITIFNNVPFDAIVHDDNFVLNNFNFDANMGLLTIGIMAVLIFGVLKISEFFLIIYGAIKTSNGEKFKYPITIPFIK